MQLISEQHEELTCDIVPRNGENSFLGTLKYNGFEVGVITDSNSNGIRSQFRTMSGFLDAGGMIRRSIIMLGYHNDDLSRDVLSMDGEVLGTWDIDEEEWSNFRVDGETEIECNAPSPWMLQDAIANWAERRNLKAKDK